MILYLNDEVHGNPVCSFNSGVKDDYIDFYKKDSMANCHEDTLECEHFNPASNLENYPAWPGFYGSMHDKLDATPSEKANYLNNFLKYKPSNERYAVLPDILGSEGRYTVKNSKPVVNLQNLLARQSQQRIAAEFTSTSVLKRIWPFRYALLGALACNDDIRISDEQNHQLPAERKFAIESFLPSELKEKAFPSFAALAKSALQNHLQNVKKMMELRRKSGEFHLDQFEHQYQKDMKNDPEKAIETFQPADQDGFWNSTRLGYLAANLGIPIEGWSMTFGPTLDFEAGGTNFKAVLPLLAPWLLDPQLDGDLKLNLGTYLGTKPDSIQCESLREKSMKALRDSGLTTWPTVRDLSEEQQHSADPARVPLRLSACIGCHVLGNAPGIPFSIFALNTLNNFFREHTAAIPLQR